MRLILFVFFTGIVSTAFAQRPNVIFILTDDMGYGDLSSYGKPAYTTPHLDKLASQGMKFLNAYSGAPVCTPTRVSFITGRYPAKMPIGLLEPLVPQKRDSAYGITPEYTTVATRMAGANYETALIGKWHLGFLPKHYPLKNGYQYFYGMLSGATDYISHKSDGRVEDLHEMDSLIERKGYLTDLLADKAVEYIQRSHAKPFFLTINFNAPHWPWQRPGDEPYADTVAMVKGGSPETYAAMMKSLDDAVGKIMKSVDDSGLAANTIVIFTNDNGGERYSNHGGLSGAKMTLREGGIKVPAFVRWQGKIKAGTVTSQVAITMDWTATIVAAGNVKVNKGDLDGVDLLPVLTGKRQAFDRALYWRITQRRQQQAMREGKWKYLKDEKGEYLFDLFIDSSESKDVKSENQEVFTSLKNKYLTWSRTLLQPLPLADVK
jgi:arylsulfatase A-like enzyme